MNYVKSLLTAAAATAVFSSAQATELEVTHWWTSGGEAAAVAELAKAFNATGNTWIDGAIAGSSGVARPIMISRITGGDPMGATQFNHGKQALELIDAGLMQDLTEIAEKEHWKDVIRPRSLLDSCTVDGRIYCAPLNIHSWQWLWLSHKAFDDAGIPVPTNWNEFVAAAPALKKAGKIPLAMGQQAWQASSTFGVLLSAIAGPKVYNSVLGNHDVNAAAGPEITAVFKAAEKARQLAAESHVQDWNQATNLVITGQAGGQIMGDWAQGEFQVAGQVAGKDYTCLPGLGLHEELSTGGDAFYFPRLDDPEKTRAQLELAASMVRPTTQVAFNLKKGSLPVRGDVDLNTTNTCMKKGLAILNKGKVISSSDQLVDPNTAGELEELFAEFFNNPELSVEEAQARFVELIANAE